MSAPDTITEAPQQIEADVRNEARFDESIGIYPEFIGGYGVLILRRELDRQGLRYL